MQLYSFFNSSTSYRVRIALALKGLPADYHGVNIRTGEHRAAGYAELNAAPGSQRVLKSGQAKAAATPAAMLAANTLRAPVLEIKRLSIWMPTI
ncbi:hypothetical protein AVKW3434_09675 [Acidovorax sp. SUPP3434]|nr:hypothetical protein AVKW3434_09675 [Acidovorax sp. SUPP3434]